MQVIIDYLNESQLDEVASLEERAFSQPWSRAAFKDAMESDNYEYITAVCDGVVVGYAGMQLVLDEAEITNIAVAESARNRGIAGKLLEVLGTICERRNVKFLHLEVRESNSAARHLYEKNGFVIDGIRKNFYQKPVENAVLMTKFI